MTDLYAQGWRDACDAIRQELRGIAPEKVSTVVAAYQVRDIISTVRAQAVDEERPPLTEWEQRLEHFGLKP